MPDAEVVVVLTISYLSIVDIGCVPKKTLLLDFTWNKRCFDCILFPYVFVANLQEWQWEVKGNPRQCKLVDGVQNVCFLI